MNRRRVVNEFNRLFLTGRITDALQSLSGCHNQKLQSLSISGMNTVNIMGGFFIIPLQRRRVLTTKKSPAPDIVFSKSKK